MIWTIVVLIGLFPTACGWYWTWRYQRDDARMIREARKDS